MDKYALYLVSDKPKRSLQHFVNCWQRGTWSCSNSNWICFITKVSTMRKIHRLRCKIKKVFVSYTFVQVFHFELNLLETGESMNRKNTIIFDEQACARICQCPEYVRWQCHAPERYQQNPNFDKSNDNWGKICCKTTASFFLFTIP